MYANPRKHRALAWLLCLALLLTCVPTAFADDGISVATEGEADPVPPTFNGLPFIMKVPAQTDAEAAPDTDEPEVDEPEVGESEAGEPETDEPEVDEPEAGEPEVNDPEADVPNADDPNVDAPDVDVPDADAPNVDGPAMDVPVVDVPDADVPAVDEPIADEPEVDTPEEGAPEEGEGDYGIMPMWLPMDQCDHSITNEWRSLDWLNSTYAPYNEIRHLSTASTTVHVVCAKCGKELSEAPSDTLTILETHNFDDEGICYDCGYKKAPTNCNHEHTFSYTTSGAKTGLSSSAECHTYTFSKGEVVTLCLDCDTEISRETRENYTESEDHVFHGGFCDVCGYASGCKHENTYTNWSYTNMTSVTSLDDTSHKFTADLYECVLCEDCGEQISSTVASYQSEDVWEHVFDNNRICYMCGYKKTDASSDSSSSSGSSSSSKSSSSGSKAVEPVATPEPASAPSEMVDTLLSAIDEAEASGKDVSVEVVGAKDVLSVEEYDRLKALPAREQILVTLTAVGMGEAVEAAMRALNVTLSDEASALTADIVARMDAASDEDYAALQATLAEKFPTQTVAIDGEEVEVFVIELEITVDGKTTAQRYGFRYDKAAAQWLFYELNA